MGSIKWIKYSPIKQKNKGLTKNVERKTQIRQKRKTPKTHQPRNHSTHNQLHPQPPNKPKPHIHRIRRNRSPQTSRPRRPITTRSRTKNEHLKRNHLETCPERKKKNCTSTKQRKANLCSHFKPQQQRCSKCWNKKINLLNPHIEHKKQ